MQIHRFVMSRLIVNSLVLLALFAGAPARAATGPEGLACFGRWAEHATETQMRESRLKLKGGFEFGGSKPQLVELEDGTLAIFKEWRPDNNSKHEVAAYLIDRMLGLGKVPTTVWRSWNGKEGSLQLFVPDAKDPYSAGFNGWDVDMNFLDILIGNTDRSGENFLVARDGRVVAIDHERAFRVFVLPPQWVLDRALPRPSTRQRLREIPPAEWRSRLGFFLGATLEPFLAQRERVLKWLEKAPK